MILPVDKQTTLKNRSQCSAVRQKSHMGSQNIGVLLKFNSDSITTLRVLEKECLLFLLNIHPAIILRDCLDNCIVLFKETC
jgi:hypothetical protein